jgi:amino acid transporter
MSQPQETPAKTLKRELGFWSSFSLAFAFISPIIGLYGVFALALTAGGPAFWWGLVIVLAGQMLVAAVMAELASRWPVAGGISMWSRHLIGERYSWYAGWAYIWTLMITVAAVSYGGGVFLGELLGIDTSGSGTKIVLGGVLLAACTLANSVGRRWLSLLVTVSIVCEAVGSIGVGAVLMIFHRENSIGVVFDSLGTGTGNTDYVFGSFLVVLAFIGWSFVGFESAGAIAEEVTDPERKVPRAILLSLPTVAVTVMFSALAILMAIPDLPAAMRGELGDPVTATLTASLGSAATKPLLAVIVIAFVAGLVALQAAVSRSIYALARVDALPASNVLGRLSGNDSLPINAIIASAAVSLGVLFLSASQVYSILVNFATAGFYLAFLFPVLAAFIARVRGTWRPGVFNLGRAGFVINAVALIWLAFEVVNISWPRATDIPWYQNYAIAIMIPVLALAGFVVERGMGLNRRSSETASVADELAVDIH